MRFLAFACLFSLVAATAFANQKATVFPPAGCSSGEQRVITWQDGTSTTVCATGQQVMNLAIPACMDGQTVVKEGGQFTCKTVPNPPVCGVNEFLTFDGRSYACGATDVPTCGADQVLTFNGSGFICVNRTDEIPTCAVNQFLTYNGSFQCASTQQINIPVCGADEVVKSNGVTLYCDDLPDTNRFGGNFTVNMAGNYCRYSNPLTGSCSCPHGYTAYRFHDFAAGYCIYYWDQVGGPYRGSICGVYHYQCVR